MPEKTVGVIPRNHYINRDNTSHKVIGFIEYRMFQTGETIPASTVSWGGINPTSANNVRPTS